MMQMARITFLCVAVLILTSCGKIERALGRLVALAEPEPPVQRIDALLDPIDRELFHKYIAPQWERIGPKRKRNLTVHADRIRLSADSILRRTNKVTFLRWNRDPDRAQIRYALRYSGKEYEYSTDRYWDLLSESMTQEVYQSILAAMSEKTFNYIDKNRSKIVNERLCKELQMFHSIDRNYTYNYGKSYISDTELQGRMGQVVFRCQNRGMEPDDISPALEIPALTPERGEVIYLQKPTGARMHNLQGRVSNPCDGLSSAAVKLIPMDLDAKKAPLIFREFLRCQSKRYVYASYQYQHDVLVEVNDYDDVLAMPAKEVKYDQIIQRIASQPQPSCVEALAGLRYIDRYAYAHWLKGDARRPTDLISLLSSKICNCTQIQSNIGPSRDFKHAIGNNSYIPNRFFQSCGVPTPKINVQNLADPIVRYCYNSNAMLLPLWCEINSRNIAQTGVSWDEQNPEDCRMMRFRATSPYRVSMLTINNLLRHANMNTLAKYNYRRYRVLHEQYNEKQLSQALDSAQEKMMNAIRIEGTFSFSQLVQDVLSHYRKGDTSNFFDEATVRSLGKSLWEFNKIVDAHRLGVSVGLANGNDIIQSTSNKTIIVPTSLAGLGIVDAPIAVQFEYSAYIESR